jgi:hypothetical protein
MLIWRGRGFLIALAALACLAAADYATAAWSGDENYYRTHGWPILLAFALAAALVYKMRAWLGVGQTRVLVDPVANRHVVFNQESSLFFVPARYWPAVLPVLGVAFGASASLGWMR